MRQLTLLLDFEPRANPPAGDPPSFDVKSGPGTVTLLHGDESLLPAQASYDSHVEMTGMTTFVETGRMTFDEGGLRLTTVGTGVLEPSAVNGTLQGAVLWRVEGDGRFAGATGLLASSFAVATEQGEGAENQVLRLFVP